MKDFIECSKPRTALLFLGVRWNLIFRFGSLSQPLHDMSVCVLVEASNKAGTSAAKVDHMARIEKGNNLRAPKRQIF